MEFKASVETIRKVCVEACKHSKPMGMGHVHYDPSHEFKPEDFSIIFRNTGATVNLDYVAGRMVKLAIFANESWKDEKQEISWRVTDSAPSSDYQSWVCKYPTYEALLEASGVVFPEEEPEDDVEDNNESNDANINNSDNAN